METRPLLELTGATVYFGADAALDGVDFRLFPGEVHSLMGENGAGKSTLIKAITGALPLSAGELRLDGRRCGFGSPHDAQELGIRAVYQEIDLLPEHLGRGEHRARPRAAPVRDDRLGADARATRGAVLADLGLDIDPASILGRHSLAVQQLVAIARAISTDVRVLVLDEPTSSLDLDECAELFRVIRDLKRARRRDPVRLALPRPGLRDLRPRDGAARRQARRRVPHPGVAPDRPGPGDARAAAPTRCGRAPLLHVADGRKEPFLSARSLTVGSGISEADVDLMEGEVLGVAGLLGSGRTELARAITGIDKLDAGIIRIQGSDESIAGGPRSAISLGIVYSSENRRTEGIISELSVQENITLALQAERGILRRIRPSRQRELALSWVDALDIRPPDLDRPAGTLSGGNQQKVLLARLLALLPAVARARRADPRHRRRREGRGAEPGRRARRQRPVGHVHLRRARGGAAGRQPGR